MPALSAAILVDSTPCNVQALTDEHKTDAESNHFAIGWEVQQGKCKKRAGVGTLQGCVSRRTLRFAHCDAHYCAAAQTPGPQSYPAPNLPGPCGGRFSTGNPKSDTGAPLRLPHSSACVWSKVSYCQWVRNTTQRLTPTIIIDWQVYRAARMPGPHDYEAIPLKNYKEAEPRHILGTKGPKSSRDG